MNGLKLNGKQDLVQKFQRSLTSTTHGRDMTKPAPERPSSSLVNNQSDGGGFIRCATCHLSCVALQDCFLVRDVHQPKDASLEERFKRVESIFNVTLEKKLQNCFLAALPEKDQATFKLAAVQCKCGSKLGNLQDATAMEGDWTKDFGARVVCLKCSEVVLQFNDEPESFIATPKWVSYKFAFTPPVTSLSTLSMKFISAKWPKHLRKGQLKGASLADVNLDRRHQNLKELATDLEQQLQEDLKFSWEAPGRKTVVLCCLAMNVLICFI